VVTNVIYGGNNLQSISMNDLGAGGFRIIGTKGSQLFGSAVVAAGDINKDGYADILFKNGDHSAVFLLYGGPALTNMNTSAGFFQGVTFPRFSTSSFIFGYSVSRAGDFNGDGYDDLMIGSYSLSAVLNCQIDVVFGGPSLPATFELRTMISTMVVRYLTSTTDQAGGSVSGGVDLNRDGFDDIMFGALNAHGGVGAAHVVFGSAAPVDSSVFHLGNGVLSLNATIAMSFFGRIVSMEEKVRGPNTQGILVTGGGNNLYYFHDLLSLGSSAHSVTPTFSPSANPSVSPSVAPSVVPSEFPTFLPTVVPSFPVTFVPTVTPVITPTAVASVIASESPTVIPTQTPTLIPSVGPTMTPTPLPTAFPSFRPSAPTCSPTVVPTPIPTARTKGSIVANTGFTVNSVNGGTTLTPTSQETIKQSIANVSQTAVNNVDLVSVTRTNRRLLLSSSSSSSVVHRMLASVWLFSYKVVAEIHFNLIDFPGLNESYVAGTKSKVLIQSMESHEFDRIISYYAIINNATQLMSNATVSDVIITTAIIPAPDDSSSGSKDDLTVGEIVGIVVGAVAGACLLSVLIYLAVVQRKSQSKARRTIPMVEPDYKPERVPHSDNAVVESSSDKQFDCLKKQQMATSSSPDVVKLY
jgi:hypothetical protein